jgi:elongation factor 1 alpha-like protein
VAPGMAVAVWPGGARGRVKSVARWGGAVPAAGSGDCVDLVLSGLPAEAVGPASVLTWLGQPGPTALKFKALVSVLQLGGQGLALPVAQGQQYQLHAHCAAEPCVVSRLLRTVAGGGEAAGGGGGGRRATLVAKPRLLLPGDTAIVRIVLARPRCLASYAECRRLGSFVLRYHGSTVVVGKVLKVSR